MASPTFPRIGTPSSFSWKSPRFGSYCQWPISQPSTSKNKLESQWCASLDYDASLAGREQTVHRTIERSPHPIATVLNTGRTLRSIQSALKKGLEKGQGLQTLKQLNAIIANDGSEIYCNTQNQETASWVQQLHQNQQDPGWAKYILDKTGWTVEGANKAFSLSLEPLVNQGQSETLPRRGHSVIRHQYTQKDQTYTLWQSDDYPIVALEYNKSHTEQQARKDGRLLGKALQKAVAARGIQTRLVMEEAPNRGLLVYKLVPRGINKAKALSYLLKHHINSKKVFHFGDGENDVPVMGRAQLAGLPVFSFLSGESFKILHFLQQRLQRLPLQFTVLSNHPQSLGPLLENLWDVPPEAPPFPAKLNQHNTIQQWPKGFNSPYPLPTPIHSENFLPLHQALREQQGNMSAIGYATALGALDAAVGFEWPSEKWLLDRLTKDLQKVPTSNRPAFWLGRVLYYMMDLARLKGLQMDDDFLLPPTPDHPLKPEAATKAFEASIQPLNSGTLEQEQLNQAFLNGVRLVQSYGLDPDQTLRDAMVQYDDVVTRMGTLALAKYPGFQTLDMESQWLPLWRQAQKS